MSTITNVRVWMILLLLVSVGTVSAQPNVDLFEDFSTPGLPGRLFVPPEATDGPRPVILFLHGAGETGTNNTAQINGNINNLITAAQDRGAFIYAPQATNFGWTNGTRTDLVMSMVDQLLDQQNADADRMYVTGLSMGGGGSWTFASRYSDRFAANVPIAGVGPGADFDAANLLDMPTWAYHARNDNVVSVNFSRSRVNQILTAAGEPILSFPDAGGPNFEFVSDDPDLRYTEYRSGGHGIWPVVYNSPEMYDWMFSQSVPEPASGFVLVIASCLLVARYRRR